MYIANLKVQRSSRPDGAPQRSLSEALNLTVKAETLPKLKEKLVAHVGLLDEEDVDGHQ